MITTSVMKMPDPARQLHSSYTKAGGIGVIRAVAVLLLSAVGLALAQLRASEPTPSTQNVHPELNLKALAEPLQDLTPEEKKVVDEAIKLIREMRDAEALTSLTNLTRSNSRNSSIRVLRAYVLLELGNLTGALDDATLAEASGVRASYKCWFLAQVAFLAGNKPLCRREIKHVSHDSHYGSQAENLRRTLDVQPASK